MSGLRKAKKYDWKDSNLALFGSDTEKQVKKESAQTEKAWQGSGQSPGLQIWRIVKFKVTSWPKEDYGKFYDGDSYIILNTYLEEEELKYDVHFWIGKFSTQDEYGTAAYKTVELDTFHDDKPVQHREVQGHESELFKSYFNNYTILKGGADTGFRRVTPEEYKPRLLHFRKGAGKEVVIKEVALKRDNLASGDVFILDLGLEIYQWNGETCNKDEKFKAVQYLQTIKSERGGKPKVESLDQREISDEHKFYSFLTDEDDDDDDDDVADEHDWTSTRVSDSDGSMDFEETAGFTSVGDLNGNDVYILENAKHCFVWIGSGASVDERRNALPYANKYLQDKDYPYLPISVVSEGKENAEFKRMVPGSA